MILFHYFSFKNFHLILIEFLIFIIQKVIEEKYMSKGSSFKFNQMFGYKGPNQKVHQEDIINTMKFDPSGDFLALGDKAGRVIVFETNKKSKKKQESFDYYAEFQSHSKQFDCLRSQQVQQSITDICWLNTQSIYKKLVTTNAKSIKLWKIFEKPQKKVTKSGGSQLKMPKLQVVDNSFIANVQHYFPSKHQSDIHSLSKSYNQEYLLSFDEVQGFLWSLEKPDKPFIVIDYLKDSQIQDVKQNITCGKFHPTSDSILAFGTNKKTLKLHDMRSSLRQSDGGILFKYDQKDVKNFFSDFVSSYSSVEFLKNGKYIAARDFLTVKVWDVCNTKKPLLDVTLQQNYKSKLCQMFQNDCIYDKFKLSSSVDGTMMLTGNYNNNFHMIDLLDGTNTQYELNYKKQTLTKNMGSGKLGSISKMDYQRKTIPLDFNSKKNMVAVGSLNCFFIYSL